MTRQWTFDMPHATRFTAARIEHLNTWLPALIQSRRLATAVDAGCGVGVVSRYLADQGLRVLGLDARPENVAEARSRCSGMSFEVQDLQDPAVQRLGSFDLGVCLGLLYHLENPFAAVRHLFSLTRDVLVLESMVAPGKGPVALLRSEVKAEDQGLNYVALVPSAACLVQMLLWSGFPYVYEPTRLPDHEDFRARWNEGPRRTMLVATKAPLESALFRAKRVPALSGNIWLRPWARQLQNLARRLRALPGWLGGKLSGGAGR